MLLLGCPGFGKKMIYYILSKNISITPYCVVADDDDGCGDTNVVESMSSAVTLNLFIRFLLLSIFYLFYFVFLSIEADDSLNLSPTIITT